MIMGWTGADRAFATEAYFKTGEFIIATKRDFHVHFMLYRNDAVLDRK